MNFPFVRTIKAWLMLVAMLFVGNCYGDTGPVENNPVLSNVSLDQVKKTNCCDSFKLPKQLSKNLEVTPIVRAVFANLPTLCQKSLQICEKIYPEMTSLFSLAMTGFLGGVQCPGVDDKAPFFVAGFLHNGKMEMVSLFKAQPTSPLMKNLMANKQETQIVKKISISNKKSTDWYLLGNKDLVEKIAGCLRKSFPEIYEDDNGLKQPMTLEFNCAAIKEIVDFNVHCPIVNFLLNLLVVPNFENIALGVDIENNDIVLKTSVEAKNAGPLAFYLRSVKSKLNQMRIIKWDSQEAISDVGYYDFKASRALFEEIINNIYSDTSKDEAIVQLRNASKIIHSLLRKLLDFLGKNLTGSFQGYADFQGEGGRFSTKGFGFFEKTPLLTAELLTAFLKDFAQEINKAKKTFVEKKLCFYELLNVVSCEFKPSILQHNDCVIDKFYWKVAEKEGYGLLYFTVCKNYLLYSDDIENLKRLIDRMKAINVFTYVAKCDWQEKIEIRLSNLFSLWGVNLNSADTIRMEHAINLPTNTFSITTRLPLGALSQLLKSFSNTMLPSKEGGAIKVEDKEKGSKNSEQGNKVSE